MLNTKLKTEKTGKIRIEIYLEGTNADKFLHYQQREKLTSRAQTAYKLMMETLDSEVSASEVVAVPETAAV